MLDCTGLWLRGPLKDIGYSDTKTVMLSSITTRVNQIEPRCALLKSTEYQNFSYVILYNFVVV